jgi:DNA helicase II / ATP-dependent DNA helicase PcrA
MEEEMFPYRGMDSGGHEELEEERRLAYVAITRARKRLVVTHTEARQIFGSTRWGRPSRFLGDLPPESVDMKATRGVSSQRERYVDRPAFSGGYAGAHGGVPSWRYPQSAPGARAGAPNLSPGERYVEREFVDESADADDCQVPLRRGSRVRHDRFGEGEVRRVDASGDPSVVAFFPGWGEKKILARFLKRA